MFTGVGKFRAAVLPFVNFLTPVFFLIFLFLLGKIILELVLGDIYSKGSKLRCEFAENLEQFLKYINQQKLKSYLPSNILEKLEKVHECTFSELKQLADVIEKHLRTLPQDTDVKSLLIFLKGSRVSQDRYDSIEEAKKSKTRLKIINLLRKRVSFYGVFSLFEKVESILMTNDIIERSSDSRVERVLYLETQLRDLREATNYLSDSYSSIN